MYTVISIWQKRKLGTISSLHPLSLSRLFPFPTNIFLLSSFSVLTADFFKLDEWNSKVKKFVKNEKHGSLIVVNPIGTDLFGLHFFYSSLQKAE